MKSSHFFVEKLSRNRWEVCYFSFFLLLFSVFWSSAITFNDKGGLVAGHANLWGDWAIHFTMGSAMAYREFIPTSSPLMLDAAFSYPFATNLISAGLIRLGMPFHLAFVIPSFIFCLLLVVAVYVFFRIFLNNRFVALFAASLFFFNGGVGFYYYLADVFNSSTPLSTLINPLHEYTNHEPKHIKWISVISSMMFPQRSFALGASVCLFALSIIFYSFQFMREKSRAPLWKANVLAGVLLGVLPILHTHSFLAAFIILGFWSIADLIIAARDQIKQRLIQWLIIVGVTSLIALPIIFTYFIGNVGEHFFQWFPGWYAKEFNINWFVMWFKNWTFVPFLGFAGFIILIAQQQTPRQKWHAGLVIAPGVLLFLVPNLFLTQPWIWDNTKLFIWSSVFLSPMAAFATCYLFKKQGPAFQLITRLCLWLSHVFKPDNRYTLVSLEPPQQKNDDRPIAIADEKNTNVDDAAIDNPESSSVDLGGDSYEGTADSEDSQDKHKEEVFDVSDANVAPVPQHVELKKYVSERAQRCVNYWSNTLRRSMFVFLILFMCSAGFLDAYYTARTDLHAFTMYNKNELALAEWVKENTATDAIWLTSTKHNHWLFNLTGRRALMTYTGWLWTHGYDYQGIERDAKRIFRTGNPTLITKYGIDYIVVDNAAKKDMRANVRRLDQSFEVIKRLGQYTIYRTQK